MSILKNGVIAIEGLMFHAHHGYYAEERIKGGKFKVDVYVRGDLQKGALTDDLEKTINYELISEVIERVMKEEHHLLEHVAYRILNEMSGIDGIWKARVRVSKLSPPLKHNVERVFVELEKTFRKPAQRKKY